MDALITKEEAADLLDVSVSRVRQLREKGTLTAHKNGAGRLRFRRAQVLALRQARETWRAEQRAS